MTAALRDPTWRGNLVRAGDAQRLRMAQLVRRFVVPALGLVVLVAAMAVLNILAQWLADVTRINVVRVEGSFGPVTRSEIEHSLGTMVAGHSLLNLPIANIASELGALSWVSAVDVYRVWPQGVIVRVTEKVPVAHWNEDGFISHAGEIFQPENMGSVGRLPLLAGPENKAGKVMEFYSAVNAMMVPMGLSVHQLTLNEHLSWEIITENGMRLRVDQEDSLARVRRFLSVYGTQLAELSDQIDRVDLRYIGGFSVHWALPSIVALRAARVVQP